MYASVRAASPGVTRIAPTPSILAVANLIRPRCTGYLTTISEVRHRRFAISRNLTCLVGGSRMSAADNRACGTQSVSCYRVGEKDRRDGRSGQCWATQIFAI